MKRLAFEASLALALVLLWGSVVTALSIGGALLVHPAFGVGVGVACIWITVFLWIAAVERMDGGK